MEIKKFKKLKNNIYELELDNGSLVKLYDDVIVKYSLLINKKIDNKLLDEITKYNTSLDAYYLSLKYISKKLRCEKEIEKYLTKLDFNKDVIDKTISKLNKDGYLKHDIYIKSYINDIYNFNNYGPDKIKFNLRELGFNLNEIDPYLEDKDFRSKAIKIIDKKVKANHKLSNYMLKQNIANYLINLGYPRDIFYDYLDNIKINNKDILVKEASNYIKKYSKKYENKELLYFVKDKLYKKGYNSNEIDEVLNELL